MEKKDGWTCSICCLQYSSYKPERKPMLLECGHTFCSTCISGIQRKCPKCRQEFDSARCRPNYSLLDLLGEMREMKLTESTVGEPAPQQAAKYIDVVIDTPTGKVVEKVKIVEVFVEKLIEVPVQRIVKKDVAFHIEEAVIVEKIVDRPIEVITERPIEKLVEVVEETIKYVEVPVQNIVKVPVEKIKNGPDGKFVEVEVEKVRMVEVQIPKFSGCPVIVRKNVVCEVIVENPIIVKTKKDVVYERLVKVPREKIVEVPVQYPVYVPSNGPGVPSKRS